MESGDTLTQSPLQYSVTRMPIVLLTIALSVLLSSCPSPDNDDPYSFPNLEATVASIDWAGDGVTRGEVVTMGGADEFPLRVAISFSAVDAAAEQQALTDRLLAAGFTRIRESRHSDTFQGDDWKIHVQQGGSAENPAVKLFVNIVDDDARAAEILAPIAGALSTLP